MTCPYDGEAMGLVDKVCELQRRICEYERYINDLTLMLAKWELLTVTKHDLPYPADWVWEKVIGLIKETQTNK